MVYVRAKDGTQLSSTENHAKVRVLLKTGRAKVLRRDPFIIKLLYDTGHDIPECASNINEKISNACCMLDKEYLHSTPCSKIVLKGGYMKI